MKTRLFERYSGLLFPLSLLLALGVTACGDDGAAGRDGPSGADVVPIGAVTSSTAAAEITSVRISGPPVVDFWIEDDLGRGIVGLEAGSSGNVRFTIAKLMVGSNGNPDGWQSYVNRTETPTAGVGTATAPTTQAHYDREGTLVDNGDGSYRYTFLADVTSATDPTTGGAIPYEPNLTHRVAIQFGGVPAVNPIYDFVPAGGAISTMREIVEIDSCNTCHGKLALHGSGRIEARYCVTCHNPGSADANSGNTVDFPVMIHKIHRGHNLPSVAAGGAYVIYGFRDSEHNYSEVGLPQDIRNCRKCHNISDATPQGDQWKTRPSVAACGSCHDDVNFADGTNHSDGEVVADNSMCQQCHGPEAIELVHVTENATPNNPALPAGVSNITYEILAVSANGAGRPRVDLRISRDEQPLDLLNLPADLAGPGRWPGLLLAWTMPQDGIDSPVDYNNFGLGGNQPISVSLGDVADGSEGALTARADGVFTATLDAAFPAGSGMRAVALQGYFQQEVGDEIVARHAPSVVGAVAGDAVRRVVVDNDKCLACHEALELHGGNRVNETGVCVTCHNPNLSSSGRSVVDPDPDVTSILGPDVLTYPEATNNFKDMVHGIHASGQRATDYEFVRNRRNGFYYNWSEVTFPGILKDCGTCHLEGTYELPLADGVLLSTNRTTGVADGQDVSTDAVEAAREAMPNGTDWVISPTTATCYACHDRTVAVAHMELNGGAINWDRSGLLALSPVETCDVCHGSGTVADVATVHNR